MQKEHLNIVSTNEVFVPLTYHIIYLFPYFSLIVAKLFLFVPLF